MPFGKYIYIPARSIAMSRSAMLYSVQYSSLVDTILSQFSKVVVPVYTPLSSI